MDVKLDIGIRLTKLAELVEQLLMEVLKIVKNVVLLMELLLLVVNVLMIKLQLVMLVLLEDSWMKKPLLLILKLLKKEVSTPIMKIKMITRKLFLMVSMLMEIVSTHLIVKTENYSMMKMEN
jgi:hypothetical protein